MISIELEREHLARAEQHVREGEERVRLQSDLVDRLRERGHAVAEAEALLALLLDTLRTWRDHRDAIQRTISQIEARKI